MNELRLFGGVCARILLVLVVWALTCLLFVIDYIAIHLKISHLVRSGPNEMFALWFFAGGFVGIGECSSAVQYGWAMWKQIRSTFVLWIVGTTISIFIVRLAMTLLHAPGDTGDSIGLFGPLLFLIYLYFRSAVRESRRDYGSYRGCYEDIDELLYGQREVTNRIPGEPNAEGGGRPVDE